MTTYEPGVVATATVRGVPNVQVVHSERSTDDWVSTRAVEGWCFHAPAVVTDIRPLVVLDLAYVAGTLEALNYAKELLRGLHAERLLKNLINQITAQTQPPKPAEPLGLGAVVSDDGYIYHRDAGGVWRDRLNRAYWWRELIHPVVKHEGWSE